MKSVLILSGFAMVSITGFTTVYTVSNDPAKPAQFTSPIAALAAASPGDTLYIYGSPNFYGDLTIDKSITIIGAGYNTRKEGYYKTVFQDFYLTAGTLSNIEINGISGRSILTAVAQVHYSNIIVRNCNLITGIQGQAGSSVGCGSTFTNWLIENCIFVNFSTSGNLACNPVTPTINGYLVKNSVLQSISAGVQNVVFANCQFGVNTSNLFQSVRNCTFNNSIFFRMNFTQNSSNVNNQFNNCLTYLTELPSQTFDLNNWTGGSNGSANNCIINQNPLWTTVPDNNMFQLPPYSSPTVWNPLIQAGSPAINAGSDGTDIGLTGGLVPYNYLAEPKIPVIRRYQLVNSVVPPTGTVSATVTATKAQ